MIVRMIVVRIVSTKVILIVHYKSKNVRNDNVGGCQNYGPFLDPYYNTAPNI